MPCDILNKKYTGSESMNYDNGMKYAGDDEMYKADLKLWLRYTQDRKNEIREAYDNKDAKRCRIEMHSLKSNAKRIGADELSNLAYKMEKAAADGDWMSLGKLMQPLTEEWEVTDEEVLNITGPVSETPAQSNGTYITADMYSETVRQMKDCLISYDSDGAVDAANMILGYEISPDVRDKLIRIRNAADDFDYRGALTLTAALTSHP